MTNNNEPKNFSSVDDKLEQMLLDQRRIFFSDSVMPDTAADTIQKLWYLESKDPGKPILLIINSPGGSIDAGFAIYDQIKMISSPVTTLVTGLAASMGSILSLAAEKGNRLSTTNARIMIHQPSISGVIEGQATDLAIQAREIIKMRKSIIKLYVDATGKKAEELDKIIDRDTWMTAQEAKEFGLIDRIVTSFDDV